MELQHHCNITAKAPITLYTYTQKQDYPYYHRTKLRSIPKYSLLERALELGVSRMTNNKHRELLVLSLLKSLRGAHKMTSMLLERHHQDGCKGRGNFSPWFYPSVRPPHHPHCVRHLCSTNSEEERSFRSNNGQQHSNRHSKQVCSQVRASDRFVAFQLLLPKPLSALNCYFLTPQFQI